MPKQEVRTESLREDGANVGRRARSRFARTGIPAIRFELVSHWKNIHAEIAQRDPENPQPEDPDAGKVRKALRGATRMTRRTVKNNMEAVKRIPESNVIQVIKEETAVALFEGIVYVLTEKVKAKPGSNIDSSPRNKSKRTPPVV